MSFRIVEKSVVSGLSMLWTLTGCWAESKVRCTSVAVLYYLHSGLLQPAHSSHPRLTVQYHMVSSPQMSCKPFLGILMSHVQANLRTLGSEFAGIVGSTDVCLLDVLSSVNCDTTTKGGARASKAVETTFLRIYSETSFQQRNVKAMPHEVAMSSSISFLS